MQIMCRCQKRQLVLLYRPKLLQKRLEQPEIRRFLLRYGYTADMDLAACLMRLQNRIAEKPEFPHEIGLFLSYPPEDVLGFICNRACNHKCVGCWKAMAWILVLGFCRCIRSMRRCSHSMPTSLASPWLLTPQVAKTGAVLPGPKG